MGVATPGDGPEGHESRRLRDGTRRLVALAAYGEAEVEGPKEASSSTAPDGWRRASQAHRSCRLLMNWGGPRTPSPQSQGDCRRGADHWRRGQPRFVLQGGGIPEVGRECHPDHDRQGGVEAEVWKTPSFRAAGLFTSRWEAQGQSGAELKREFTQLAGLCLVNQGLLRPRPVATYVSRGCRMEVCGSSSSDAKSLKRDVLVDLLDMNCFPDSAKVGWILAGGLAEHSARVAPVSWQGPSPQACSMGGRLQHRSYA